MKSKKTETKDSRKVVGHEAEVKKPKPVHVKPSFYTYCFETLKTIAKEYGYNLVIHGSLHRDLDLIAIPWEEELGNVKKMIQQFADIVGGTILKDHKLKNGVYVQTDGSEKPHGRIVYIINLNRGEFKGYDPEYYFDISVIKG